MRLLHSKTLEFREFPNHKDVAYAILSHTWGADEVLFQELDGLNAKATPHAIKQKAGYQKIKACCTQAASDGFDYTWVDTCCIDKRSSAELSEAINSMYKWYRDSAVCYAYLEDVPNDTDPMPQMDNFRESRWFKRGWTLQELLAPTSLEFYGDCWICRGQQASLGTRRSLMTEISDITRIPIDVLQGLKLSIYSVAQKMSWAAGRQTTREEDRAYSLMGLFEVNMPLLYGEGDRAFIRLQEEIMKISADETIFAWEIPSIANAAGEISGMLALSPDLFTSSASFIEAEDLTMDKLRKIPFSITNIGLRLEARLLKLSDFDPSVEQIYTPKNLFGCTLYIAVLNCCLSPSRKLIGVLLCSPGKAEATKLESKIPFVRIGAGPCGGLKLLGGTSLLALQPSDYENAAIFAAISQPFEFLWRHSLGELMSTPNIWMDMVRRSDTSSTQKVKKPYSPEKLWLNCSPRGFCVVEASPKDALEIGGSSPFVIATYFTSIVRCAALRFEDEKDSFVMTCKFGALETGIKIVIYAPGQAISDFEPENSTSYTKRLLEKRLMVNDRGSCVLNSGRVASASIRRQKVGSWCGYGLDVTVSQKRTEQLPESNDMMD